MAPLRVCRGAVAGQQPEQQQPKRGVGDSSMPDLIEHTKKIEEAMAETQRLLTQCIDELGRLLKSGTALMRAATVMDALLKASSWPPML